MGGLSFWHIMIVGLLFVLLFGRGRISDVMGDVAKGIRSFKKGLQDEDEDVRDDKPRTITEERVEAAKPKSNDDAKTH
ncbi:twin-arginine translocase TatA/TatE family subunit [Govanella unica]|uniref:Sec-independent protein translocase protein TatA n=1 Tax=Govanella unica TaxID=2975056 RepID=A0A9X3Z6L1_9PROT|nr:twin-arginine translocase TatA/TatE family subunit [Govania unica]MDA5193320.1 twin-arginine translocase TatA/TatE family subunit [Govania unica]